MQCSSTAACCELQKSTMITARSSSFESSCAIHHAVTYVLSYARHPLFRRHHLPYGISIMRSLQSPSSWKSSSWSMVGSPPRMRNRMTNDTLWEKLATAYRESKQIRDHSHWLFLLQRRARTRKNRSPRCLRCRRS